MLITKRACRIGLGLCLMLLSRPGWSLAPLQQQDAPAQKQVEPAKPTETQPQNKDAAPQKVEPSQPAPAANTSVPEAKSDSAELPSAPVVKPPQTLDEQKAAPPALDAQKPSGTAAAETHKTGGVAASTPTGMAIAPAKQHRRRVFWVRLGAVAGTGAALGTVLALSRSTSSKPPGVR